MNNRQLIAVALVLVALAWFVSDQSGGNLPPPTPAPSGALNLRGKFVGATAAADAVAVAALCRELGDKIQQDGESETPRLKTGVALDDLRVAARELRMSGESIGERQPRMRAAVEAFMTKHLGEDGGPISDEQRAKWVECFYEIGRSAADAAR